MRSDLPHLAAGAGAAAAAGLVFGVWLSLPDGVPSSDYASAPREIATVDPNLAAYRAMLQQEGVRPEPYVLATYTPPAPAVAEPPAEPEPAYADAEADDRRAWRRADYRTYEPPREAYPAYEPAPDAPYERAYAGWSGHRRYVPPPEPADRDDFAEREADYGAPVPQPDYPAPIRDEGREGRAFAYGPPPGWGPPEWPGPAYGPGWR